MHFILFLLMSTQLTGLYLRNILRMVHIFYKENTLQEESSLLIKKRFACFQFKKKTTPLM